MGLPLATARLWPPSVTPATASIPRSWLWNVVLAKGRRRDRRVDAVIAAAVRNVVAHQCPGRALLDEDLVAVVGQAVALDAVRGADDVDRTRCAVRDVVVAA